MTIVDLTIQTLEDMLWVVCHCIIIIIIIKYYRIYGHYSRVQYKLNTGGFNYITWITVKSRDAMLLT